MANSEYAELQMLVKDSRLTSNNPIADIFTGFFKYSIKIVIDFL